MISRYLDPKNDLAFKKIFGQEKHKRLPIAFLNAVFDLKGKDTIIDLEFLTTIQPPEIEARKESVVDVLVRDQAGSKYIIEMQVAKVEGFEKRAQFYAAKTYCAHFNTGKPYGDLKKVIFLAITSYVVFSEKADYKSDHVILDNKTYENDLQDFSFTFVELPKFTKTIDQLDNLEDQWYYFLKHAQDDKTIGEILVSNPEIKEAYDIVDRIHWSEQELEAYDKIGMSAADAQGVLIAARKDGYKEGHEIGQKEGHEIGHTEGLKAGLKEGLKEGLKAGLKEAQIEMAKNLITMGLLLGQIKQATGLSEQDIKNIKNTES